MDLLVLFENFSLMLLVKWLLVILLTVYVLFALLMMKQISAMTKAVQMKDDYIIRGLGVLHLGFAIVVWILSWMPSTTL
jgi:hypothetical protein